MHAFSVATTGVTRINIKIDCFSLHKTRVRTLVRPASAAQLGVLSAAPSLQAADMRRWARGASSSCPHLLLQLLGPGMAGGLAWGLGQPWHGSGWLWGGRWDLHGRAMVLLPPVQCFCLEGSFPFLCFGWVVDTWHCIVGVACFLSLSSAEAECVLAAKQV